MAENINRLETKLESYTTVKFSDEFGYDWEGEYTKPKYFDQSLPELLYASHDFLYFPTDDMLHVRSFLETLAGNSPLPDAMGEAATNDVFSIIQAYSAEPSFEWQTEKYTREYKGSDYSSKHTFKVDGQFTHARATFEDDNQQEVYYLFISYVGVTYPVRDPEE